MIYISEEYTCNFKDNMEPEKKVLMCIAKMLQKKNIPNLQITWAISIAEIILNSNKENIKISEEIIKPVFLKNLTRRNFQRLAAPKKSAVPKRPAVFKIDKGDEVYETNETYKTNEAYETDEGNEYYNKIINIDENKEE
ncbi:hypothetical protein Glove_123g65 [Diversispora epigaea]|uniref:Uncharacterized protein n=1 Tax=Diversispora epigaea TaxID=1348612 RepID=A0A397J7M3_9GLOM|nr:hypothetical protein Glove_123g65 [Diversispora epigaea]